MGRCGVCWRGVVTAMVVLVAERACRVQVEVAELFNHYRMMTQSAGKLSQMSKHMNPRNMQQSMAQMQNALPPQLMRQMQQVGGMGGMQDLLKSMQGMGLGGLPGMKM
jgi:hypothetical protein